MVNESAPSPDLLPPSCNKDAEDLVSIDTKDAAKLRRGRKIISTAEQREIAQFYITNQDTMSYEAVGERFAVSSKTVQRYVAKFKRS